MLVAKIDELVDRSTTLLDEIRPVIEQLEPDRARSCHTAITMAAVMLDEIKLRAHARPLDEPDPLRPGVSFYPPSAYGSWGGAASRLPALATGRRRRHRRQG